MNDEDLCERLLKCPETYRSLLREEYGRNTLTVIARRRILRNIKKGILGRAYLNGSRGRESLIFHLDKEYMIIIVNQHRDFRYYVCDGIKKLGASEVELVGCKELVKNEWKSFDKGLVIKTWDVIKCI